MAELPAVALTGPLKAVLTAMADQYGYKLPVGAIASASRLSASAVRRVLDELGKAKLVQHTLAPGHDRHPPRIVYWLTGAGADVARSIR